MSIDKGNFMNKEVRVRFAPSPTGYLHVGGLRSAIYNYLFAKANNGKFIIRIEDTDMSRSEQKYEKLLLDQLIWMGVIYDEGPDIPNSPYGPYRQSERLDIYKKYADQLIANGYAYYCFCTDDELKLEKESAATESRVPQYNGKCRNLSEAEVNEKINAGIKPVVRFKAWNEDITFNDLIRNEITFKAGMVGDFVLVRSDGYPTYNFAVTIDDSLMKISHVLRGEEHLSNTYRQIMIYRNLGLELPEFGHFSLILGKDADGNVSKLSKRHGATSLDAFKDEGFLKEALFNYLVLLGWSSESGDEILSIDRLKKEFSLSRVSISPSIFDGVKLRWMNEQYMKAIPEDLRLLVVEPFLNKTRLQNISHNNLQKLIKIFWSASQTLSDVNMHITKFLDQMDVTHPDERLNTDITKKIIATFRDEIFNLQNANADSMAEAIKIVGKKLAVKGKDLFIPIRIALTGEEHGPELKLVIDYLGKETILKKLDLFIIR